MGGMEHCARARGAEGGRTRHWQVAHQAGLPGWCGYGVEAGVRM